MFGKRKQKLKTPVLRYEVSDSWWYQEGFPTWEEAEARRSEIEGYMEAGKTFRSSGGNLVNAALIKRIWINEVH